MGEYFEATSPPDKRVPCKVDLQALRDATVSGKKETLNDLAPQPQPN